MNKKYLHKPLIIIYNLIAFSILILSIYKFNSNNITLYLTDYLFIAILIISFILVSKYSITLKSTTLNFNDFIIIVCYMVFNIYLTVIFITICYLILFIIDFKSNRKLNLLNENIYVINNSMVIIAVFISSILLSFFDKIYYLKYYETTTVILFSFILLSVNYILYCLELSFQKSSLVVITLENGLYLILLNFLLSTVLASAAVFLCNLYDYIPIVVMTVFIIFISYSLNKIDKLKINNDNLRNINSCTSFLISNADFKVKLQHVIRTIDAIIPFIYCGIYFTRETYNNLYPMAYKCNILVETEDLKFLSSADNIMFNNIIGGSIVYKEGAFFSSSINIVNNYSNEIKYLIAVPIKTSDAVVGFVLICLDRYLELDGELELLSSIVSNLGIVNYYINESLKNNIISYKDHDGILKYINFNIKSKIFFTLALIEIINYKEIIQSYNRDFYDSFKIEIERVILTVLSSNDIILSFEKEEIYIVFNLLDSKNSDYKLNELSELLKNFTFKDIHINIKIKFSTSEYPMDGISGDEILDIAYRKLHY